MLLYHKAVAGADTDDTPVAIRMTPPLRYGWAVGATPLISTAKIGQSGDMGRTKGGRVRRVNRRTAGGNKQRAGGTAGHPAGEPPDTLGAAGAGRRVPFVRGAWGDLRTFAAVKISINRKHIRDYDRK